MIDGIINSLRLLEFYLTTFDETWKSEAVKGVFPPQAKGDVERIDAEVKSIASLSEITATFADWKDIGVWDASDLLTFLLTSRLAVACADHVEKMNRPKFQDAATYVFRFMNYLLLTNVHSPNENQGDMKPYIDDRWKTPKTYDEAQERLRDEIAKNFARRTFDNEDVRKAVLEAFGENALDEQGYAAMLKKKMMPYVTPPLLMKNVGLARELFVLFSLSGKNLGFVIPMLLYQRLMKGVGGFVSSDVPRVYMVRTPDFLLVHEGRVMGVELGRERGVFGTAKAELITNFSASTAIPTAQIAVNMGNPNLNRDSDWSDFGLKCNRCYRSFILCNAYIKGELGLGPQFAGLPDTELLCDKICGEHSANCEESAVLGGVRNFKTGQCNKKIIHARCRIDEDEISAGPAPIYPIIEGLDGIREGLGAV